MNEALPFAIVDGAMLPAAYRESLAPGAVITTADGRVIQRPRYYYAVDCWQTARRTHVTPHFALWELLDVDVREAPLLRIFPRYVPCAVSVLAVHLELFRMAVNLPVRVAANGGYRSPMLEGSDPASTHAWGTAVNIYQIGDEPMTERDTVERYAAIARRTLPSAWCRPYGVEPGQTTDHLHIDLGYLISVPRE